MSDRARFFEWIWWFQSTRVLGLNAKQYVQVYRAATGGFATARWLDRMGAEGVRQDRSAHRGVRYFAVPIKTNRGRRKPTPMLTYPKQYTLELDREEKRWTQNQDQ